jgi:hypothetical protein
VEGRLLLLTDIDGNLVDSHLGIDLLGSAVLSGRYRCQGNGPGSLCQLEATTDTPLATTKPHEPFMLKGSEQSGFTGEYGFKGTGALFSVRAKSIYN